MNELRTYSELIKKSSFSERFDYVKLKGVVGTSTFGDERFINQSFYRSKEWRQIRDYVILRDDACDLAYPGLRIRYKVYIHHLNPISVEDIVNKTELLTDPEFLVCVSDLTHLAIHYGDASIIPSDYSPRTPGDTTLWRH